MKKLRVFESFSGVGSQRMALRNIGCNFEVVGISEVDKNALLAYDAIHENQEGGVAEKTKEEMISEMREANIAYNFSTGKDEMPRGEKDIRRLYIAHKRSKNYGDITKINTDKLPDFDFFTYSFPCKNISVAGKQAGLEKGSGTQSSLIWECERIIRAKMPKFLMMENVKNICGKAHMEDFQDWINLLSEMGYISYWKVLNGRDYKVPQNRERVIMISVLDNREFCFPDKVPLTIRVKDILEETVDSKYYIDINKLIVKDGSMDGSMCAVGASRGRYIDSLDKNKRTKQHLEINKNEVSNSLTTACTDNSACLKQVGMLNVKGNESNRRVYDVYGLSPTINSMNGGNRQPKMLIPIDKSNSCPKELGVANCITTREDGGVSRGSIGVVAEVDISNALEETMIDDTHGFDGARYYQNMSPSLRATRSELEVFDDLRVRKLTPLECWRLMGFSDQDYAKAKDIGGLSSSKLYERAGRGIVVPMLEEIFKKLFKEYIVN